jgi:methionyl aminopeptidase
MIRYKTKKDLEMLRVSGKILAEVLRVLATEAREGVPLSFLDATASALLKSKGAKSAFLGYKPESSSKPFPASTCLSLNDEIVHGLPRPTVLKKGDVLKIDLGVNYKGFITDSATTVVIGSVSRKVQNLITTTEESLYDAIAACRHGAHLGDIGYAVEKRLKKGKFKAIQGLTGHGTGFKLHEDPTVWNFGRKGEGLMLREGLVIAIEPMAAIGTDFTIEDAHGVFKTADGSIAAHFEHTVFITKTGCEILTK